MAVLIAIPSKYPGLSIQLSQLCRNFLCQLIEDAVIPRVLSKQWQGEFCRCSIDVIGGKQCDGSVDHLKRFRHNAGPSPKAGKPVAQPTVDPLNGHRFILADVVPPNRQERVVRRIIVCTVQRDAPGLQPLQQPVQRGGITTATFPVDEALARAIKSQPDPQLVLFFEGNARVRPVPSRLRSRPARVEGAVRALRHELGSKSGSTGSKHRVAWRWHSSTGPMCITIQRFLSSTAARRAAA